MTNDRLRNAETRVRETRAKARAALNERNTLIREAAQTGWTQAQIAKVIGHTRGSINQIANPTKRNTP